MKALFDPISDALHGQVVDELPAPPSPGTFRNIGGGKDFRGKERPKPWTIAISDAEIDRVLVELRRIEASMEHVALSGAEGADYRAVDLVRQSRVYVAAISVYFERRERSIAEASTLRRDLDLFQRARAEGVLKMALDQAESDAQRHDEVITTMDRIVAMARMLTKDSNGSCVRHMGSALDEMTGAAAAGLRWTPAPTHEDAVARVQSRTPCVRLPASQAGDRCYLSPTARLSLVQRLFTGLQYVGMILEMECRDRGDDLRAAIDRDQRLAEFIATEIADAFVKALTGDLGASVRKLPISELSRAATQAANASRAAATVATEARKFGADFARSVAWSSAKEMNTFVEHPDPTMDTRYRTVRFINGLSNSFTFASRALSARSDQLDDYELDALVHNVEHTTRGEIGQRLDEIVARHRQQIEPLGDTRTDIGYPSPRKTVTRAVRLSREGAPSRLAMVRHETDVAPTVRREGRQRVAAVRELGRALGGPEVFDGLHRLQDQAWVNAPDEEFEFVRWIGPPKRGGSLDLSFLADVVGPAVPIERVRGVPLEETMGLGDDDDAR